MPTSTDPPAELAPAPRPRGLVRRTIVTLFWLIFIFLFPNIIKGAAGVIGGKAAEQALDRWCKQLLPGWLVGGPNPPPQPLPAEPPEAIGPSNEADQRTTTPGRPLPHASPPAVVLASQPSAPFDAIPSSKANGPQKPKMVQPVPVTVDDIK